MSNTFIYHRLTPDDNAWVLEVFRKWGADFVISRGQKIYPDNLNGYYASDRNGKRTGLITFDIQNDQCEIVTLDAFVKCSGIGTELIKKVIEEIKPKGANQLR